MHPLLLLILLVALLFFISWLRRAPPPARWNALVIAGIGLLLLLVLTGRVHWLLAAVGGALALAQRVLAATQFLNMFKSMRGPTPGKTSDIETGFLKMSLNHDTGEMSGTILKGRFRGAALDELSVEELVELRMECESEDQQSVAVLEAYMDRRFGQDWREGEGAAPHSRPAAGNGTMSPQEAREILGVSTDATEQEIIEAHRRLMQKLHPDRGGSTYLAAKLNQAKDLLLGA